jgi:hypothetical protein
MLVITSETAAGREMSPFSTYAGLFLFSKVSQWRRYGVGSGEWMGKRAAGSSPIKSRYERK